MSFEVRRCALSTAPDLVRRCQRLRYVVYHDELGLDPPDMRHEERLDVQANDPVCDFVSVERSCDGELVGCLRLQPPDSGPYYAEDEFVLTDRYWREHRFVEGARFAILPEYRNGVVPLLLFREFRRYCREQRADRLLSVIIVSDPNTHMATALAALRWLRSRMSFELDRGRPRLDYEYGPFASLTTAAIHAEIGCAAEADPSALPAMLRMLAGDRSTLCSRPAYCRKFSTWNFLLSTDLTSAAERQPGVTP